MKNAVQIPAHCDLDFSSPIMLWDEAIPLGSGLTGCLIYGDGAPLKFSLDRGDLWDCRPAPDVLREDYTYEKLIRLVNAGDQQGIRKYYTSFYNACATPTKLPAGKMQLVFTQPKNLSSHLSLQRAEASVTLESEGKKVLVSSFLSAETHFGYLKVVGARPQIQLLPHDFTPAEKDLGVALTTTSTKRMGYPSPTEVRLGTVVGVRQKISDGAFALLYAKKETPDGLEMVYSVASSRDGEGWLEGTAAALEQALNDGYDNVILPHLEWWNRFWEKSALSLPDKVLEKNWYLTQYYIGSCSRKGCPPMPLQGVWTADSGFLPPWKGDYHGDANLQFSYYAPLKADHLEECESFLDFFTDRNRTAGREFARTFFDAPGGACMPSVFAFDGTSLGGWPMYCTNIVNQIWELHVFYQYYKYTGNEAFLSDVLLPQLKECEVVVRRWLKEDEDGFLTLPLSSSPELHDDELESWLPSISNNDLALLRFLYGTLHQLTGDAEYEKILLRLPELMADETGFVIHKGCPLPESHRHHSHMMGAFPLDLVDWEDPEDRDTVQRSLDRLRTLGPEWWVGFSFAWMADLEARMGQGEEAARHLRLLTDHLYSVNGFHLNGDYRRTGLTRYTYRPFTLESNIMLAEALQEMMMQCYDGVIRIFPGVPEEWLQDCSFDGLLAYGNVKVSAVAKNGIVRSVTLKARRDGTVNLRNPKTGTVDAFSMKNGETKELTF